MRLAYLVSQYPAFNHTFILREVRMLRDLGFEIEVISIRPCDREPRFLTQQEREEHARTWYVRTLGPFGIAWANLLAFASLPVGYARALVSALRLAGWNPGRQVRYLAYFAQAMVVGVRLRRLGITHVHTHFSSTVGLLLTRTGRTTMSLTIHGPDEFNDAVGFHLAEKVQAAELVACISNFARSQVMRFCRPADWDRLAVSRLGVDPAVFAPRPHRAEPEVMELLCVGRLAPAKAQLLLIRACERLRGRRRFRLRIVGEGPDRRLLEREIARLELGQMIELTGALNQDRVRELYRECDIFVLGSLAEGVPVVLMEAMAMEIPCISTYIAGIPELIRDQAEGVLVAASDVGALADAVARLMDDAALREKLGKQGRARVLAEYDLGRNTERLAELLRRRVGAGSVVEKR